MLLESKNEDDLERLENVEEMITAAGQFAREDPNRTIADFLETITLASDVDAWDEKQDCVSVMTLHSAKGLEFPVVYMLAVEQGMLPHARSLEHSDEIEEERRLCFVGMTRAKQELYLCNSRYREFGGRGNYCVPSEFLDELPPEVEREEAPSGSVAGQAAAAYWRGSGSGWDDTGIRKPKPAKDDNGLFVGAFVEHAEHGMGQIVDLSGYGANRIARVRFNNGVKVFYVSRVKLTVVED
jgi:DNA helicase-2/ATP-dependent DNA helicase PcrA